MLPKGPLLLMLVVLLIAAVLLMTAVCSPVVARAEPEAQAAEMLLPAAGTLYLRHTPKLTNPPAAHFEGGSEVLHSAELCDGAHVTSSQISGLFDPDTGPLASKSSVARAQSTEWIMAGASSSAAASLPSGQLPGSGPEMGSNGGFGVLEVERVLLEQTVPERAKAALYAIVGGGGTNDRAGQPTELNFETVKEVYKATHTVHAALKVEQFEALKAADLTYLHAAFGFSLVDHLGYPSRLDKDASFVQIGKNVEMQMKRGAKAFPGCSRAALELLCCSAPAAATPAAADAAAAASPISAASERTPVPQRQIGMPVGGYEAVIELTGQLAELRREHDLLERGCLTQRDELATEVTCRKLAETAEAAACKRADLSEGEFRKVAK
ncbi:hypothetical protein T492DRAFT_872592, partial [Pavlovales sp. CCMP2436]